MHEIASSCGHGSHAWATYTVWTLIFAVLNFRGFRGSTAIRESLVPRKFRPALTGQRITSILMNSDVIILQNGYRGVVNTGVA